MKALVVAEGGPVVADVPQPACGSEQVLVKVRACGLNRADVGMAAGGRHGGSGGPGTVLGMEFAGEVVAVGAQVEGLAPGDQVMCTGAGGFAEYAVADQGRAWAFQGPRLSFAAAATLPVALQTMHDALITHGGMRTGDAVLIQGASAGVGLMAMKIARLRGARLVIGTSGDPARRARLAECGAHLALDPRDANWVDQVLKATGGAGVDVAIDQVSNGTINDTMRATRILGRIINVGRLGGNRGEFDFDLHALRRISYVGVTFRTRSIDEVREITRAMRADLWDDVTAGRLDLPLDRSFPFDEAPQALQHMAANRHFGKVVLTL